jgi:plastocyanin
MQRTRLWHRAVLLCIVSAVVAAGTIGAAQGASRTRTVKVRDSVYTPKKLTVPSGTKVVWDFDGQLPHNVEVSRGPELFSSAIVKHGTFSHRMRKRGTYRIVCTLHQNMTMKVIVK